MSFETSQKDPAYQYVERAYIKERTSATALSQLSRAVSFVAHEVMVFMRCLVQCVTMRESAEKDFFKGQHLKGAVNRGKIADRAIYESFEHYPLKLNARGASLCQEKENEKTLACEINDEGKCFGGVSYFLSEHLKGQDIHALAKNVEDGVPISAAITQSLHTAISKSVGLSVGSDAICNVFAMATVVDEKPYEEFHQGWKSQLGDVSFSDHEIHIFKAVDSFSRKYCESQFDFTKREFTTSFVDFTEEYLKLTWKEELNETDRARLLIAAHSIENKDDWRHLCSVEMSLKVSNLEIENYISGPENILNSLPDLEPGDYKLTFPVMSFGKFTGYHTVALIVESEGFSYLYDPNIGTGWISPWWNERMETVERLFERYHCFSRHSKPFGHFFQRFLKTSAPPPLDFFLHKVRKSDATV